ncbi:hypothetical protein LTS01_000514 [Friedmanniomyces endolithicus]|nr:hypothetical protein LTS01_000514 [Friedmanniomyces endolithicus]
MPILPPGGQTLKRSTRTTYRKGSLKRGERVPFSKRVQSRRHSGSENGDETGAQSPVTAGADEREPILGLTRVQTEPTPMPSGGETQSDYHSDARQGSRRRVGLGASQSTENLQHDAEVPRPIQDRRRSPPREPAQVERQQQPQQPQQPHQGLQGLQARPFTSRLTSGGRTTAQLPGYNNSNPLPHIIETLPDGTKVPVGPLAAHAFPERRSSHEQPRPPQRGGAHMRPVPGRQQAVHTSTLDDISSNPSPLPGSGSTRTDALTMVPTFEDKKVERKDSMRKSSWKWILGSDDDDHREKEKKAAAAKEEKAMGEGGTASSLKARASKLTKTPTEKARLDVLQNSIDGTTPSRGRESIVLNRADIQLEDERKKESKKSTEIPKKEREKDSGLLSAIFGVKKKSFDGEQKEKKRKSDRGHSPEPPMRILKPDIDYNWTRFSILEERAIYRMAHIKLANPRRALYSQVLLSNFMYSYLAKVQALHPQMQIPASQQQKAAQQQQQQQQQSKSDQPAEHSQYQRWQEQQSRQEPDHGNGHSSARRTGDGPSTAGASSSSSSQQQRTIYDQQYRSAFDHDNGHASGGGGHDQRSAEEYENSFVQVGGQQYSREAAQARVNGIMGAPHHSGGGGGGGGGGSGGGGGGGGGGPSGAHGYSVASTHDYLGYPKDQQPFGTGQEGLWDDEDKAEELW